MTDTFVPRPEMAAKIADMLTPDPLMGELSGLFLAAPRRTGKSTFLRRDLVPTLKARGQVVLYVDLWADRSADPGDLIKACLAQGIEEHARPVARLRKKLPIDRIGALGFNLGFKDGAEANLTATDALSVLVEATQGDVVLIVDEAQQALETEAGRNAMYALKAARDAVNQGSGPGLLYLVMTGSHRDKLAALVHDRKAPFFGARVRDFPRLGLEYTAAMAERVNRKLAPDAQISTHAMDQAFAALGHRPELLNACLRGWILSEGSGVEEWMALVSRTVRENEAARRSELEALSDLQLALLKLIAQSSGDFAPYAEATRESLRAGEAAEPPSKTAIQNALAELRDLHLIWRPGYGQYALENSDIHRILLET